MTSIPFPLGKVLSNAFKANDITKLVPESLLPGTHSWCQVLYQSGAVKKTRCYKIDVGRLGEQKGNLEVTQEK